MNFNTQDITTAVVGVGWGWCILEICGFVEPRIHTLVGNSLIVTSPFVVKYLVGRAKPITKQKMQLFDQMMGAMATEIKKVALDETERNYPIPPPPSSPIDVDDIIASNNYIKQQVELFTKLHEQTDRIKEKLQKVNRIATDPTKPRCADCNYCCVLCEADRDTILECVNGFEHWWKCNDCEGEPPIPEPPVTMHSLDGTRLFPNRYWECGIRKRSRSERGRSREKIKPVRTDRSRSRDREDNDDFFGDFTQQTGTRDLVYTTSECGDPNCDHAWQRRVAGYDDRYDVCIKCGMEVPKN